MMFACCASGALDWPCAMSEASHTVATFCRSQRLTAVEILDLRHFSSADLRPLLDQEVETWGGLLAWDYRSSSEMILRYVDAKILPGYAAIERGSLTLSATSPENGTATEEIEVRYTAQSLEIGFNSRYLLDITEQIEGDGARFALADAASPTVVRDSADDSALYVLMPMRV